MNWYDLITEAGNLKNELVGIRRHLHMYPELGFEEHRTASMIEGTLHRLGISTLRVAGTGIIGLLPGRGPGRTVALRADMDALPITDEKTVDYASKIPGRMHACGHDAHTAALLGGAMLLTKYKWDFAGNVKFLFQPAEETVGGALPLIEGGAMENPHVDAVFGLHTDVDIDVGKIGVIYGKANAASDPFDVVIYGRGSHGAAPHEGVDAIAVVAQIITALQNVVSRNVDPVDAAVVTVGVIQGGYQRNIIADEVRLSGIIRTLGPDTRQKVLQRVKDTVIGVASALGAEATVRIIPGYPSLINDNPMVDLVKSTAEDLLGRKNVVL
ncbi:MAG: M20 metallopeptidase family protein, partial [Bacillota bacterium]